MFGTISVFWADAQLQVVLAPGNITPAELSYRNLLQELGDEPHVVMKELEVYAADAPPPNEGLGSEAEGIRRKADAAAYESRGDLLSLG